MRALARIPDDARQSPDVPRFAIIAGPDSTRNLSGWVFASHEEALAALALYPRGSCTAILPDAAMATRIAAQELVFRSTPGLFPYVYMGES